MNDTTPIPAPEFRWPNASHRVAVMGSTGSGKTQFGIYLLSKMPIETMPFVIVNYKYDELIDAIPFAKHIEYSDTPDKPGVYILHPDPDEVDEMEAWMLRRWRQRDVGLVFDEAYMLPDKKALRAICTQGRSLRIPAIFMSQRPVDCSRFIFTEASFISEFYLNDERDRKTVEAMIPDQFRMLPPPDRFRCYWYDRTEANPHAFFYLHPVPEAPIILESFEDRLRSRRKAI